MFRSCEGFCQTCKYCCYIIASFPPSPLVSLSKRTGTTYITHSNFPLPSGCSLRTEPVPSTLPVFAALAVTQQVTSLGAMVGWVQALGCVFGWRGRLGLFLLWQNLPGPDQGGIIYPAPPEASISSSWASMPC